MTTSQAWLLECGEGLSVAVGFHEMSELLHNKNSYGIPGSPDYCCRILVWQNDKLLPVMDLARLAGLRKQGGSAPFVAILNYQEAPHEPLQQFALEIDTAPRRIEVDDEQVCDFPPTLAGGLLQPVTACCVRHEDNTVLIVDLARLCSAELRDLANAA